jgi:hypothetical protein
MSFNGTGTFVINSSGQPVVSSTVISATVFNALTADLATGLSTCITKDGQTTPTNNIPMGGFKITGLGAATVGTDAVRLSQLQAGTAQLLAVSGTDTLTALGTPTLTAYATGNTFYFVAAATNTTSVTLNVDGLGAKAVTRHGSTALVAGDILAGEVCLVVYDGTRFQLLNPGSYTNLNVSGVLSLAAGAVGTPSLAASGDLNTGLWFPAADTIAASVGGVEALRVNSAGVLSLVNNPTLSGGTVNGVLYLNGSKAATSGSDLTYNGTNLALGGSAGTTPSLNRGFYVQSDTNNHVIGYSLYVNDGANNRRGSMFLDDSAGLWGWDVTASSGVPSYVWRSVSVEQMRLDSSGNLGIGTSSPAQRLDVTGALNSVQARFGNVAGRGLEISTELVGGTNDAGATLNAPVAGGTLIFKTVNSERARIDSSGNLGIGTSAPVNKLSVLGKIAASDSNFTASAYIHASPDSGANRDIGQFSVSGATNGLQIKWNHASSKMHIVINDIPTSSAGLPGGTLYSDGGTIKIA